MKGRIIGREGRKIRTLENLTGVDMIIRLSPEVVVISGYDPIRREIARCSLERLIQNGRIHPARIEEVVEKVTAEIEDSILDEGEKYAFQLGIPG
jgi:ribonuclease Y